MVKHKKETDVLLQLIRAALHQKYNETIVWQDSYDVEKLEEMILMQGLVPMVYPVIMQQIGPSWGVLQKELKAFYEEAAYKGVTQEYEIQSLLDAMEQDGIDCLPMKGWILRNYYPDPLMRSMCDLDVFIKNLDSRKMQAWMEEHGYTADHVEQETHDIYLKPPYMNIELHRHLTSTSHLRPSEKKQVYAMERSVWEENRLEPGKKHIHRFRTEDFYAHYLMHFYKHFTVSGAGIRFLADGYVFLKREGPTLDRTYLEQRLKPFNLNAFAKRIEEIAMACFEGQPLDADDMLVVDYLMDAGTHGSKEVGETLAVVDRGKGSFSHNRMTSFWKRCFLPLGAMQDRYQNLHRWPWLLPFYWGIRIGKIAFFERYKIDMMQENQTGEAYDQIKAICKAAGVMSEMT